MKTSIYSALFAIMISLSASVHAVPPIPPTAPKKKTEPVVIVCKHDLELTEEEIEDLNNDIEKFVSFDENLREICFKK